MKACLILLLAILVLLSLSSAKPSAFEKDTSGSDLKDLESMLSGEHRGAEYAESVLPNQMPGQLQSQMSHIGPLYSPPYKNEFLNDTFFGSFLRELWGGPSISKQNLTWPEILLTGLPYQNTSTTAKSSGTSRHKIKPVLVNEPDF
ncbi:MAG: hypothetical protein ACE14P_13990 [Methanotrichaceae archaeon]